MPGFGLFHLLQSAGQERMLRSPSMDDIDKTYSTSVDILLAFTKEHCEEWKAFVNSLGASEEVLLTAIEDGLNKNETRAEGIPSTILIGKLEDLGKAPISQPVKDAMRQATKEAREAGSVANPGRLIQILLSEPGAAREIILSISGQESLTKAMPSLIVRDFTPPGFDKDKLHARVEQLKTKMMADLERKHGKPSIDQEAERDARFEKNPEAYMKPIDLAKALARRPALEKYAFSFRSVTCLMAAENEARIRRAPEVKLDHLFFSLLQEGTETTKYFEARKIDWLTMRNDLDKALPTFEEGPRWPPKSSEFVRNHLEDTLMERFINPLSSPSEIEGLTHEEISKLIEEWGDKMQAAHQAQRPREFSDLLWLIPCLKDQQTMAFGYLTKAGITIEEIETNTDSRF